jgi:hypothetical protein
MKVLELSGYFRLPDDFPEFPTTAEEAKAAMDLFARYWLGPDPDPIDGPTPTEIPKRPDGSESDELWKEFWTLVHQGRRLNALGSVATVEAEEAPPLRMEG